MYIYNQCTLMLLILICLSVTLPANAYESAYTKTPVDKYEFKELPPSRILETSDKGEYFDQSNQLFRRLFDYISDQKISMTVPVEADMNPSTMRFYIGEREKNRSFSDTATVTVKDYPARTVVSLGARGGYSRKNVMDKVEQLEQWVETQHNIRPAGEAYVVFWNGPFTLWFLKRFEVHIPVEKTD